MMQTSPGASRGASSMSTTRLGGHVEDAHLAGERRRSAPSTGRGTRSCRPDADRGLGDLLHAVEVRREARDDEPAVGVVAEQRRASLSPTVDSDGVKPGRSALVESESRRRIPPPRRAISPRSARSVVRPSTGREVELEVAGVQDRARRRVVRGRRTRAGTECVTGTNSQSNGPIRRRSPSCDRDQLGAAEHPGFLDAVAGEAERQLRAVDRHRDVAEQVREPAGVVLVARG